MVSESLKVFKFVRKRVNDKLGVGGGELAVEVVDLRLGEVDLKGDGLVDGEDFKGDGLWWAEEGVFESGQGREKLFGCLGAKF